MAERARTRRPGEPVEATHGRAAWGIPEASSGAPVALPAEWEEIITPEGERALVARLSTRRAQARFAGAFTMTFAAATFVLARESLHRVEVMVPTFILLACTIGLAAVTVWLARGRWEWRIGSGRVTLRRRYGGNVRDVFEARRLLLDSSTDSDGDVWYGLHALAEAAPAPSVIHWRTVPPKNMRSVARVMNEAESVRDLGTWLSRASGIALEDRTTPQAREDELADLRTMLEKSGRFGQWAAKLVERLEDGRRKAG